ncbi:hypothetical protein PTTG_28361 [Puccinia triticina 1-1 BBBD Race 1]|uniref:Uncharacterized protein n=2 Tax=Puccinia triticina TaxID=208348 RepID=A0A180GDF0_PUCT1|nr:uncharacterized protein PtA15_7A334 [Puccinia triticina]OAV90372.1 hypothetical protein PTTG_28361 [Puccinia triticina 1-1 BBBD Race 1]WAQ86608.1 hypothetical protein PtA15_7A334 [Puccinia triticina]
MPAQKTLFAFILVVSALAGLASSSPVPTSATGTTAASFENNLGATGAVLKRRLNWSCNNRNVLCEGGGHPPKKRSENNGSVEETSKA